MAWVTPAQAIAGTPATAADFNTHENDLLHLKDRVDNPPRASLSHSTTQSINNATDTAVAFDTEAVDSATLHDTVTDNNRINIPTAEIGWWIITAWVEFVSNATGQRKIEIRSSTGSVLASLQLDAAAGSNATRLAIAVEVFFGVSNWVEVAVSQNSGGALNLAASRRFTARRST